MSLTGLASSDILMKRAVCLLFVLIVLSSVIAFGQGRRMPVYMNSLKDNWYVQVGFDMSLQNPYGYNPKDVFPKGQTFGVDLAGGHWFTHELGLRAKANWENGIPLLENKRAEWLAPFHEKGVNMDMGGYLSFTGDVLFNIHNLFREYDESCQWDFFVFPRAGLAYNFGAVKGSPLLGVGVGGSYSFNDRISTYFDAAYNAVSSGFTGVIKNTGIGMNSNGYIDFNVGVQVGIGNQSFTKADQSIYHRGKVLLGESFWDNWFVQFGFDMTLFKPYNRSFSGVFPKGKTFGVDMAVGKWFSPQIALRGRINWENGIPLFRNNHLEWVAPAGANGVNMDEGGCVGLYLDIPISITNMIMCDTDRKWNLYMFPRAGLASNFAIESCSPMVGGGLGCMYKINEQWSIYYDTAFQGITSEFFDDVGKTGSKAGTKFNGFMDIHIGIQWNI